MSSSVLSEYLNFYATQDVITKLPESARSLLEGLKGLPRDELVKQVCAAAQKVIVHPFLLHIYPDVTDADRIRTTSSTQDPTVPLSQSSAEATPTQSLALDAQRAAYDTSRRTMSEMCTRMSDLGWGSNGTKTKLLGVCRHFSVLAVSLFRELGVPARARCGFAGYFSGNWEDHWIVEVWDGKKWQSVDAQLDPIMVERLGIKWSPLDVPRGLESRGFSVGTESYLACTRKDNPYPADQFGIENVRGLFFIEGDALLDFLSLNKLELLPWDGDRASFLAQPPIPGSPRDQLLHKLLSAVNDLEQTQPTDSSTEAELEAHVEAWKRVRELFENGGPSVRPESLEKLFDVRTLAGPPPSGPSSSGPPPS